MNTPSSRFDGRKLPRLPVNELPLVEATAAALKGYGEIVDDPQAHRIEVVHPPARGWRPVDLGGSAEQGIIATTFTFTWHGDVLLFEDDVGANEVVGWSTLPPDADPERATAPRERVLLWRATYHPTGGELVSPMGGGPFVVPLALPGDDVSPEAFVAFWCDGSTGLYIHPNIWHYSVYPVGDRSRYFNRHSAVHACVSVNFAEEFGCYVAAPLGSGLIS